MADIVEELRSRADRLRQALHQIAGDRGGHSGNPRKRNIARDALKGIPYTGVWSQTPPDEPGWYWWWNPPDIGCKVMRVIGDKEIGFQCATAGQSFGPVELIGGEWHSIHLRQPD